MRLALIFLPSLATWLIAEIDASIPRSSSGSITSTRPSLDDGSAESHPRSPAWNISPKINQQGYLCDLFRRIPGEESVDCPPYSTSPTSRTQQQQTLNEPVIIRQVPGDGCCLFHAVAISLNLIQGRHLRMDDASSLRELKVMSRRLRLTAVDCLRSCKEVRQLRNTRYGNAIANKRRYRRLFIQGYESMATSQLLRDVSAQYGITPEEYCNLMEQDSYWGGGPEIVALCNVLERPIHVYELVASERYLNGDCESIQSETRVPDHLINKQFCLRRMATFGSPKYDSKVPLHILSADSRFPDVSPEVMKTSGNHFMAIFPVNTMRRHVNITHEEFNSQRKHRSVRGGGDASSIDGCHDERIMLAEELEESWLSHQEWCNFFEYSAPLDGNSDWLSDQIPMRTSSCWYRKLFHQHEED